MPFFALKNALAKDLSNFFSLKQLDPEFFLQQFSLPPQPQLGHLSLPCFKLAKYLDKNNNDAAVFISEKFVTPGVNVSAIGPYANFRWDVDLLYRDTIDLILQQSEKYGSDSSGKGRKIVIEYGSPNIAKKLAFQHIRSLLIGNSLANVYNFLGYSTTRINFIGDWGTQFARLLAAVELWGDLKLIETAHWSLAMNHLFELYVRFHADLETQPERTERAEQCLRRLESQDASLVALWSKIRHVSIESMQFTLKRMGIVFDQLEGESNYVSSIGVTLELIKKKCQAKPSEGAWIVELDDLSTPALIQKKDGTTLYLTRDIAAALSRQDQFGFDRMLYVVSEQQRLHFQQLFGVLGKMGLNWSARCEHVSFGTVLFGSEKMSTREGNVIFLDSLLDESKRRAREQSLKNPDLADPDGVAEQVGLGAVVFGELSSNRQRDIEFDFKTILALDGDTGPYVQYALVRCRSLLAKALERNDRPISINFSSYKFASEEEQLILTLSQLRTVLHKVLEENEPHHLARYCVDLARVLNRFYYQLPVLQAAESLQRQVRLNLIRATEIVLASGLRLLSVPCPSEM